MNHRQWIPPFRDRFLQPDNLSMDRSLEQSYDSEATESPTDGAHRTSSSRSSRIFDDTRLTKGERIGATFGLVVTILIGLYFVLSSLRIRKRRRTRDQSGTGKKKHRTSRRDDTDDECNSEVTIINGMTKPPFNPDEDEDSETTECTQSTNEVDNEVAVVYHAMGRNSYRNPADARTRRPLEEESVMTSASATSYYTENSSKYRDASRFSAGSNSSVSQDVSRRSYSLATIVLDNVWPRAALRAIDEDDVSSNGCSTRYVSHCDDIKCQFPFDEEHGKSQKPRKAIDGPTNLFMSIDDSVFDIHLGKPFNAVSIDDSVFGVQTRNPSEDDGDVFDGINDSVMGHRGDNTVFDDIR